MRDQLGLSAVLGTHAPDGRLDSAWEAPGALRGATADAPRGTHECMYRPPPFVQLTAASPSLRAPPANTMQEEVFRKREEALKQRDLELQESLIRFSKFLQENDSKRARAEKKAADEARARLAKEAEITKLTEEMDALTSEKERVDSVVDRRMRCEAIGCVANGFLLGCIDL